MTFLRLFLVQHFCQWLWWLLFAASVGSFVVNVHTYNVYVAQQQERARDGGVKFSRICAGEPVRSARLHRDCEEWERDMTLNPYWEAFVEIARAYSLCDAEQGCKASVGIVAGVVIGVVLALWALNRVSPHYKTYVEHLNDEEDRNFISNSKTCWSHLSAPWRLDSNDKKVQ